MVREVRSSGRQRDFAEAFSPGTDEADGPGTACSFAGGLHAHRLAEQRTGEDLVRANRGIGGTRHSDVTSTGSIWVPSQCFFNSEPSKV